jgi:hypothetical protein
VGFFGKNGLAHLESANLTLIIEANGEVTFSDGMMAFLQVGQVYLFIGVFSGSILHFALIHSRWNKSRQHKRINSPSFNEDLQIPHSLLKSLSWSHCKYELTIHYLPFQEFGNYEKY